ncbi:MAG: hypothetical protein HWE11_14200 [Gammaproteobacteria bacterium]|nr:hypothetical protein [Gammaproteobacteria bacterium]
MQDDHLQDAGLPQNSLQQTLLHDIRVIDNFYLDPKAVVKAALALNFVEPEDSVGWRTEHGIFVQDVLARVEQLSGLTVTQFHSPRGTAQDNGVVFQTLAAGRYRDKPNVHWDEPLSHWIMLIYLSKGIPEHCGTAFFQHKRTGLTHVPRSRDARRLGVPLPMLRQQILRDGCYKVRFRQLHQVAYRYNRAVIFPAARLHAAAAAFGADRLTGRLHQVFSFRATRV